MKNMKNILIVSDNESLVRHLKVLVETESIKKIANFNFCFSIANKNPTNLIAMKMTPINLKDMDTLFFLCIASKYFLPI